MAHEEQREKKKQRAEKDELESTIYKRKTVKRTYQLRMLKVSGVIEGQLKLT